jgi:hypothetical protein
MNSWVLTKGIVNFRKLGSSAARTDCWHGPDRRRGRLCKITSRSRQQRAGERESTLGQPEHASSSGSATADVDVMSRDSAQMLRPDGVRGSPGCLTVQYAGCKCKSNNRTAHTCDKRRVFKRGRPDGQEVARQTRARRLDLGSNGNVHPIVLGSTGGARRQARRRASPR